MPIQSIPLGQLDLSPLNVRKTRTKEHIAKMAASIEAQGILQNLMVHEAEGGKFAVAIGGTRLEALRLLAKQKKIAEDYAVPCEVRAANDPTLTEASLSENVVRESMHPADEFDAFKKLADEGQGAETIAARFGVTANMVKQRLKLALVSPKLIAAYRRDEMTLDQLMAFTLTDDHKRQEKVWKELPEWVRERGEDSPIRRALTEQHIKLDSSRAQFVGVEAYEAAGGAVLRDLFADEGEGWLTDTDLLNRMVTDKLEGFATQIRGEGWKWVYVAPEIGYDEMNKMGRMRPSRAAPSVANAEQAAQLQAEADAIMAEHGEEPQDEAIYDRLCDLQQQIEELGEGEEFWTDEQKGIGGVVVAIAHNGQVSITRGMVKPEDKGALKKLVGAAEGVQMPTGAAVKAKSDVPAALLTELTAYKTVGAQLELAAKPDVALVAVTHALASGLFYHATGGSLHIRAHGPTYPLAVREAVEKSATGKKLAAVMKGWQKKLPKKADELWDWLGKQKPDTVNGLLAVCAAMSLDLVQNNGAEAQASAAQIVRAIKLDMADHWEATADGYFGRISKKAALEQLNGQLKPAERADIEKLKRDAAAKTLEKLVKGKGWLPPVMQAPK